MSKRSAGFSLLVGLFIFLFLGLGAPALAADNAVAGQSSVPAGKALDGPQLTLEQAVEMARANSVKLKQANLSVESAEAVRDNAARTVSSGIGVPTGYGVAMSEAGPWIALLNADLSVQNAEVQKKLVEDTLSVAVPQTYRAVQIAMEAAKVADQAFQVAELQARVTQLSYQAGASAKSDVVAAQYNLEQAKSALAQAQNGVDKAYFAFNQLVGLSAEARPILTDAITPCATDQVEDVDQMVARALAESPTLMSAKLQISKAKYQENIIDTGSNYTPYIARHNAVLSAELSDADTRDQLKQTVRNLYAQLLGVEQSYQKALVQLKQAQENLRVVKVKAEVGMATPLQVRQAELAVAQAQLDRDTYAAQHAGLLLQYKKPWVSSGNVGSSVSSATGSSGGSSGQ